MPQVTSLQVTSLQVTSLHDHCPTGNASWCKYQKNKANHTNLFKHRPGLSLPVIAKLKPEYIRLSENNLLQKCLHGKMLTWQRILKEIYVGRETLELGLYDAVSYFNIGSISIIKLFQALGIPPGKYTKDGFQTPRPA